MPKGRKKEKCCANCENAIWTTTEDQLKNIRFCNGVNSPYYKSRCTPLLSCDEYKPKFYNNFMKNIFSAVDKRWDSVSVSSVLASKNEMDKIYESVYEYADTIQNMCSEIQPTVNRARMGDENYRVSEDLAKEILAKSVGMVLRIQALEKEYRKKHGLKDPAPVSGIRLEWDGEDKKRREK